MAHTYILPIIPLTIPVPVLYTLRPTARISVLWPGSFPWNGAFTSNEDRSSLFLEARFIP
eukprot:4944517-Prymnesium_polylepis.1